MDSANFYDAGFAEDLKKFTRTWGTNNPLPIEVSSGRYWYQLHLVLVVDRRGRIRDVSFLGDLFETCQAIALDRGHQIAAISVMPDHLHLSLRGSVSDSPAAIALYYMNESCRRLNVTGVWRPSYYVGTTGVYNMNAVRS